MVEEASIKDDLIKLKKLFRVLKLSVKINVILIRFNIKLIVIGIIEVKKVIWSKTEYKRHYIYQILELWLIK